MKIETRYVWKVLSEDGLLKEPKSCGPYYDEEELNGVWRYGFETREDAMARLLEMRTKHPYDVLGEYMLIETHRIVDKE